jgi:acyl-coenzyme A thioesterase PaaI-like protein
MFNKLISLQDQFAPHNSCFGCGPANKQGLQIKSFVTDSDTVVAEWLPQAHHEAFPGMLNGGIIGALLDCHSNWATAFFLMQQSNSTTPPCCVTAYFNVSLKRPTSSNSLVKLIATPKTIEKDRAVILAKLYSEDKLCAECEGMFVAVTKGHPAFHRW